MTPQPTADRDRASVAIVGAGIAGLAAAERLRTAGRSVVLFDKGRGPGGRTSTRRGDGVRFDHGAQYFTARSPEFRAAVETWRREGWVAPWEGRIVAAGRGRLEPKTDGPERLVGVPGMNAIAKHLADPHEVRCGVRVGPVEPRGDGPVALTADDGRQLGEFDSVLITAPAPQAAELLPEQHPLRATLAAAAMTPCTAAMLELESPFELPFDGAFTDGEVLSWVARDSSKPGRGPAEAWVLHSTPAWSERHWDRDLGEQLDALLAEFEAIAGAAAPPRRSAQLHRWRYAQASVPRADGCLSAGPLTFAGDWAAGNRVEGAWRSGRAAAEHLLAARP